MLMHTNANVSTTYPVDLKCHFFLFWYRIPRVFLDNVNLQHKSIMSVLGGYVIWSAAGRLLFWKLKLWVPIALSIPFFLSLHSPTIKHCQICCINIFLNYILLSPPKLCLSCPVLSHLVTARVFLLSNLTRTLFMTLWAMIWLMIWLLLLIWPHICLFPAPPSHPPHLDAPPHFSTGCSHCLNRLLVLECMAYSYSCSNFRSSVALYVNLLWVLQTFLPMCSNIVNPVLKFNSGIFVCFHIHF